jgi:hypothetical protein
MKLRILVGLLAILLLLSVGCTGNTTTHPTTTATNTTANTNTTTTTASSIEPPSEQELRAGGFAHPEMLRITGEQLGPMMEAVPGWLESRTDFTWQMPADTGFVLVGVGMASNSEHIWGTTKFISPNVSSGEIILSDNILWLLQSCPKDKLLIFYDSGGGKDTLTTALAQTLIDLNEGYNPQNIRILWQGLARWKELHYLYWDPTKGAST